MAVSVGAKPARAKATPVSLERFMMPAGYGGAWPGFETTRSATHSNTAPPVWRAPEGPEGLAAVPVGGGRARAGLEIDHSEPQARVWRSRGRAAAQRHTQRPGPPAPGTPAGPQATTRENKNRRSRRICGFIVREGGVEPPLHHWNTDLNRARLPIPPLARTQKE